MAYTEKQDMTSDELAQLIKYNNTIMQVMGTVSGMEVVVIKEFISKCSLTDFERLKDLEYDLSEDKKEAPIYRLTSDHVLYFKGKAEIKKVGDAFTLAGYELSAHGNESPFHYQGDIIRLPNSIVERISQP